eukprot:10023569-Lingulodinium_polyedra.AAC.1
MERLSLPPEGPRRHLWRRAWGPGGGTISSVSSPPSLCRRQRPWGRRRPRGSPNFTWAPHC